MRNLIKEYIKSGKSLKDLEQEFGISSSNEYDDLICLTYSQIDSPKTESIVRQCRGIIIDKNTYDIVHYPFYRFYNFEEVPEERAKFNWDKAFGLEKIDGSLFGCFNYKDKWYISTRSQIGGFNNINYCNLTFGDLFDKAIGMSREQFFSKLNKDLDYTFELVSPFNIIVTPYIDNQLYLICVRDKQNDFQELNIEDIDISNLPIKKPKKFSLIDEKGNFRGFNEMVKLANSLPNSTDEGFVVVDYSNYNSEFGYYPRIKVKNSSYVALHHLRGTIENGNLNYGNILEIVWKNEQDEVLATFPQFKDFFIIVEEKYKIFMNNVNKELEQLKDYFSMNKEQKMDKDIKKEFALKNKSVYKSFFFVMFNRGMTFKEVIDNNRMNKKNCFKELWEGYVSKEV